MTDAAWFSDAVVAILPELYGTARRLTRNAADAEDLVAEAVARAWRAHERLADPNAFRRWIHRILANTYTSWWRAARVRPLVGASGTNCCALASGRIAQVGRLVQLGDSRTAAG